MFIKLLICGFLLLASSVVEILGDEQCDGDSSISYTTNPNLLRSNSFYDVMNGCYFDNTKYSIPAYIALQIMEWFNVEDILQYTLLALLIIPYLISYNPEDAESELQSEEAAKASRAKIQIISLLFRLGLGYSMSVWLRVAIQQERPCLLVDMVVPFDMGIYGLPSTEVFVITMLALQLIESLNAILGVVILLLVPAAQLCLGYYSIGQLLTAIGFGIALHFYTSRTPFFLRLIDIPLNLVAGVITLFLVKHHHSDLDFDWTIEFIVGFFWQIASVFLLLAQYDFMFLKTLLFKTPAGLDISDFLYYAPLNSATQAIKTSKYKQQIVMYIVVPSLFIGLSFCKVVSQWMNCVLSK